MCMHLFYSYILWISLSLSLSLSLFGFSMLCCSILIPFS